MHFRGLVELGRCGREGKTFLRTSALGLFMMGVKREHWILFSEKLDLIKVPPNWHSFRLY